MAEQLVDDLTRWANSGELLRVAVEVDPVHEIAAITDRVCRQPDGGPALLFERVRGQTMPVVTNLLGNPRRIASVFGVNSLDDLSRRFDDWLSLSLPRGKLDTWRLFPKLSELANWPPTVVKSGLCQQVVKLGRDVNLAELPVLTNWPGDAGPTITAGQLIAQSVRDAASIRQCVSVMPLQVVGRDQLLIHGHESSELWSLIHESAAQGQQLPVAVVLGGDPLAQIVAWAPRPVGTDPFILVGFLRNNPLELVAARTVPIEVPAAAEIVIEGFIDPQVPWEIGGPIGRETGFIGPAESCPVLRVTAITHRANPVFPAIIPGSAPSECHWLDRACERLFLPLARLWIPELVDWRLPFAGSTRHIAFASIRKTHAQQARQVMHALWSLPRLSTAKMLVIVDDTIDVRNEEAVWSCVAAQADPARDLVLWDGPADPLDHATYVRGVGRKVGIDATIKRSDESPTAWPTQSLKWPVELEQRLRTRWPEFGL